MFYSIKPKISSMVKGASYCISRTDLKLQFVNRIPQQINLPLKVGLHSIINKNWQQQFETEPF